MLLWSLLRSDLWFEMRALLCKTPPSGPRCWGHGEFLKAAVPFCLIEPSTRAQSPWALTIWGSADRKGSPINLCRPLPNPCSSAALNQEPIASVATLAPQGVKSYGLLFWFLVQYTIEHTYFAHTHTLNSPVAVPLYEGFVTSLIHPRCVRVCDGEGALSRCAALAQRSTPCSRQPGKSDYSYR